MRTADFEYVLPESLIAQSARLRGTSRMLTIERRSGRIRSGRVTEIPSLLDPGDVLLTNDVRVIPARLRARRPGGGGAELLLVRPMGGATWEVMARPSKRLRPGVALSLGEGVAVPVERCGESGWLVAFDPPLDERRLEKEGEVPLPPYIRRPEGPTPDDRARYQTIYAKAGRAVAAPTAGLHFTGEILEALAERGVETVSITLHVGPGTFRPVQADDPRDHVLGTEDYEIESPAATALNRALSAGRRVVCVGTTSCRALEHALLVGKGAVRAGASSADLFIVPGFRFAGTGALITNFHLPRSTLLMLVAALAGRERILTAYRLAVERGFRFYSFGDAMVVL